MEQSLNVLFFTIAGNKLLLFLTLYGLFVVDSIEQSQSTVLNNQIFNVRSSTTAVMTESSLQELQQLGASHVHLQDYIKLLINVFIFIDY